MLQCAFLVFFMQCGFALLEAGTVRIKNTKNILLKNGEAGLRAAAASTADAAAAAAIPARPTACLPACLPAPQRVYASVCAVIDASVSTLAWWSVGYAFAFGKCGDSPFIGA